MALKAALTREEILGEHPDVVAAEDWQQRLILTSNGTPRACVANACTALRMAPELKEIVAYDEFAHRAMLIRTPPWGGTLARSRVWACDDDVRLQAWLQENGVPIGQKCTVVDAVEVVAKDNGYHPISRYFESIMWDENPRLDNFLPQYFGADDTEYTRAIGPKFFISAVARIYEPGCKADNVLMLEGSQNLGKSTAVSILAEPWQCEHIPDLHSKDAMQQIQGVFLVELAELSAMRKSDVESTKAFISRQVDRFRSPYAARPQDYPRQCVFVGTTNCDTYLSDITGNRRFWPVRCQSIDLPALRRDKNQLWAEAVVRYLDREQWWLTNEQERLAEAEQEARRISNPWEAPIAEYLAPRRKTTVFLRQVLSEVLDIDVNRQNTGQARQVSDIMQRQGWTKRKRIQEGGRKQQPFTYDR